MRLALLAAADVVAIAVAALRYVVADSIAWFLVGFDDALADLGGED